MHRTKRVLFQELLGRGVVVFSHCCTGSIQTGAGGGDKKLQQSAHVLILKLIFNILLVRQKFKKKLKAGQMG